MLAHFVTVKTEKQFNTIRRTFVAVCTVRVLEAASFPPDNRHKARHFLHTALPPWLNSLRLRSYSEPPRYPRGCVEKGQRCLKCPGRGDLQDPRSPGASKYFPDQRAVLRRPAPSQAGCAHDIQVEYQKHRSIFLLVSVEVASQLESALDDIPGVGETLGPTSIQATHHAASLMTIAPRALLGQQVVGKRLPYRIKHSAKI